MLPHVANAESWARLRRGNLLAWRGWGSKPQIFGLTSAAGGHTGHQEYILDG